VKNLILFHHDPDSDDAYVDGLVMSARQEFPNTWGANEGLDHSLPDGVISHPMQIGGSERRVDRRYHVELPLRVTWRDADGKSCEADGMARDISRTGIFFVIPRDSRPTSRCSWNWCSPTRSPIAAKCDKSLWPGPCGRK
jgi:hypothetical protein